MPAASALRRLVPYYRPYPRLLAGGLVLVVVSSAHRRGRPLAAARRHRRSARRRARLPRSGRSAAGIVGIALVGGALRYWMRELLNGLSRYIEYDLRQALFVHLTTLEGAYFGRMRTGDLMARLTNDLSAVRMAAGPAIMYLTNTIFGGAFALVFMLRIDVRLTLLALLPMVLLPVVHDQAGRRDPSSLRGGAGAVQRAHDARAGELRRRARRARVSAGARRDRALLRAQRAVPREEHAPRAALRRDESDVRAARRLERRDRARTRRQPRRARHDHRRRVRRVRLVPRHAHLAAHRARLGDQSVPARRGVDDAPPRRARRRRRRFARPQRRCALPAATRRTLARVPRRRLPLPHAARDASRAGCCATCRSPCRRATRSPSSARRAAARAR